VIQGCVRGKGVGCLRVERGREGPSVTVGEDNDLADLGNEVRGEVLEGYYY